MDSYKELEKLFEKIYRLQHLLSLASWDLRVCMPPKGTHARGAAMAELKQHIHKLLVDKRTEHLLLSADGAGEALNATEQANLREMKRIYLSESALPDEFVQRKMQLMTEANTIWKASRSKNDFAGFLPIFEQLVALQREEARYRAAKTGKGLYEALFYMYEPGLSLQRLDEIFDDVRSWLPQLLRSIQEARKGIEATLIPVQTPIPKAKQDALLRYVLNVWQYDLDAGRLDETTHPFSGMAKEDSRITTRFDEHRYEMALYSTIHECGHSKYESFCGPRDRLGQPVCMARSQTIHESQSRFQEVNVAHSGAFAEFITPKLIEFLGPQPAFTPENVRKVHQSVRPGFIRIEADEVCYTLHIILRYEIERALIEGTLEAADVPRVWNEKMKAYLGLETLGRDDLGCLQDIHWSECYFGYFPTYSLGSIFAAQLMATIKKELGEETVDKCIRTGDLGPIFAKQKEKIWSQGCLYETEDLIRKATGEPLNPRYFREHLERRYLRNED